MIISLAADVNMMYISPALISDPSFEYQSMFNNVPMVGT